MTDNLQPRRRFPKVPRVPTDDLYVLDAIGLLRASHWTGSPTAPWFPATIVSTYERDYDEPPRAIRVRNEVDGAILFMVCTGEFMIAPADATSPTPLKNLLRPDGTTITAYRGYVRRLRGAMKFDAHGVRDYRFTMLPPGSTASGVIDARR